MRLKNEKKIDFKEEISEQEWTELFEKLNQAEMQMD